MRSIIERSETRFHSFLKRQSIEFHPIQRRVGRQPENHHFFGSCYGKLTVSEVAGTMRADSGSKGICTVELEKCARVQLPYPLLLFFDEQIGYCLGQHILTQRFQYFVLESRFSLRVPLFL